MSGHSLLASFSPFHRLLPSFRIHHSTIKFFASPQDTLRLFILILIPFLVISTDHQTYHIVVFFTFLPCVYTRDPYPPCLPRVFTSSVR